jgi:RHS repeat-associated protein
VAQGATTTESYSYDAVGNRLSSLGMSPYTYNLSNELISNPSTTFTYDSNGNTLTKVDISGTTTYNWDYENRLSSVVMPASGGTVAFTYDPFGRRIQKSSATATTNYLYDGSNSVIEVDQSGALAARNTQGLELDQPLATLRGGAIFYYDQDGLGSVTGLTGSTGAMGNSYTYDSFGNITASTGSSANPYTYTGRDFDSETGLRYYRARYYDPATGRFLSGDPTGFNGGINFYAYALNDPMNLRDPSGTSAGTIAAPIAELVCFESGVCETVIVVGTAVIAVGAAGYVIYHYFSDSKADADAQQKKKPSPCKKDPCQALRLQIALHQAKLAAYAANPHALDNLGILGKGFDDQIIAGRVKHLVHEILEFQKQLEECERLNGAH